LSDRTISLSGDEKQMDAMPGALLVVDARGSIVLASGETRELLGYPEEEMVGRPFEPLFPGLLSDVLSTWSDSKGRSATRREQCVHGDGGARGLVDVRLQAASVLEGRCWVAAIAKSANQGREDVARRRAERLASVGALAGGIAHDLNSMLLNMLGYAELAQREATSRQEEPLSQVVRAALRARSLVQRVLNFIRQDAEPWRALDPVYPVQEAIELIRGGLPASVRLLVRVEDGLPELHSDASLLHQLTSNLVTNAVRAVGASGTVQVALLSAARPGAEPGANRGSKSHLKLLVEDDGCGVSEEQRESFQHGDWTTSESAGLGLSIVNDIVKRHGGTLEVASTSTRGTTVEVWLPLRAPTAPCETAALGAHILVVDDDASSAELLRRQLQIEGYAVKAFASSVSALDHLRRHVDEVRLVLADHLMPELGGLALAREVRSIAKDTPVVLVSGASALVAHASLQEAGVAGILGKPYRLRELIDVVESLIGAAGGRVSVGGAC